jgi:hypothetical protein
VNKKFDEIERLNAQIFPASPLLIGLFYLPKPPPGCTGGVVVLVVIAKEITGDKCPKVVFGLGM